MGTNLSETMSESQVSQYPSRPRKLKTLYATKIFDQKKPRVRFTIEDWTSYSRSAQHLKGCNCGC